MNRSLVRSALVASATSAIVAAPAALAQTASAAETGVTDAYTKINAVVNVAIPLMLGVAAIIVAAMWAKRLISR